MNPQTPTLKEQIEQYIKQINNDLMIVQQDITQAKQNLEYAEGKKIAFHQNLSQLESLLATYTQE